MLKDTNRNRTIDAEAVRRLLATARSVSTPLPDRLAALDELTAWRRTLGPDDLAEVRDAEAGLVAALVAAGPTASRGLSYHADGGRVRRSLPMS